MIVVTDTSPLNYLILIEQVEVLPLLFQRVVVPPAVLVELNDARAPKLVANWIASPPPWLETIAPKSIDAALPLGRGETEAIALAQELRADWLLLDERKARSIAKHLGLAVTGTLSVLALAAEKELLEIATAIAALRRTNFRSPLELLDELLQKYSQYHPEDPS